MGGGGSGFEIWTADGEVVRMEAGLARQYRGTSLIRNSPLLGPYSRTVPRALWWPWGGGVFLMSEVPL